MGLFILRFWPALAPLLIYVLWLAVQRHKARRAGDKPPHFRDGPVYWVLLATLLIAGACFILLALTQPELKGEYVPPHMEKGVLVPGAVKHEEGAVK